MEKSDIGSMETICFPPPAYTRSHTNRSLHDNGTNDMTKERSDMDNSITIEQQVSIDGKNNKHDENKQQLKDTMSEREKRLDIDVEAARAIRKAEHRELRKLFRTFYGIVFFVYLINIFYIFGACIFLSRWHFESGYGARFQEALPWSLSPIVFSIALFGYNAIFQRWAFRNVGPLRTYPLLVLQVLFFAVPYIAAI